jgi:hypothetical protein
MTGHKQPRHYLRQIIIDDIKYKNELSAADGVASVASVDKYLEENYKFVTTWGGCVDEDARIKITRRNTKVFLEVYISEGGAADGGDLIEAGDVLPKRFRPAETVSGPIGVVVDTTTQMGTIKIDTDGQITIRANAAHGDFTDTKVAQVLRGSISYDISAFA